MPRGPDVTTAISLPAGRDRRMLDVRRDRALDERFRLVSLRSSRSRRRRRGGARPTADHSSEPDGTPKYSWFATGPARNRCRRSRRCCPCRRRSGGGSASSGSLSGRQTGPTVRGWMRVGLGHPSPVTTRTSSPARYATRKPSSGDQSIAVTGASASIDQRKLPAGSTARSSAPSVDPDEPAVRRPRRLVVVAEAALRAVLADDPRSARRLDQDAPGVGREVSRGSRVLLARVDSCRRSTRGPRRLPASSPDPATAATATAAIPARSVTRERGARGLALGEGCLDHLAPPLLRHRLVRGLESRAGRPSRAPPRPFAQTSPSSLGSASARASSPRRSRELTVPRGSSSISAISPGVYSRM